EAQPQAASKPVAISLRRFEITDAAVTYDDRKGKVKASLSGFDQSLSGDFSQTLVAIKTRAAADTVSLMFAGIRYLNRVRLALTADVQADLGKKSYSFRDTGLRLNELTLGVAGMVGEGGKVVDLTFNAPS